jgi:hypothetical protein
LVSIFDVHAFVVHAPIWRETIVIVVVGAS